MDQKDRDINELKGKMDLASNLVKKFKRGQATQANINELLRLLKEDEKNFIDPSAKNTHQTAKVSALNKASGTNSTASMKSPREKKRRNVRNKREGKNQRKKLEEIIEVQERNDAEESKEGTTETNMIIINTFLSFLVYFGRFSLINQRMTKL